MLEGGQRGKNGTSDPDGVLSFKRSNNLDLHGGWSKGSQLHRVFNATPVNIFIRKSHSDLNFELQSLQWY
jgi:hypothetical protein